MDLILCCSENPRTTMHQMDSLINDERLDRLQDTLDDFSMGNSWIGLMQRNRQRHIMGYNQYAAVLEIMTLSLFQNSFGKHFEFHFSSRSMQNFSKVPIINIRPLLVHGPDLSKQSVLECVESMHVACRDIGFLGLKGHGISREIRKETLALSREFFALPNEEKNRIHFSNYNHCIGYQGLGENVTLYHRDKHEAIDYYRNSSDPAHSPLNVGDRPWPQNPSGFESVFSEYIAQCLDFGQLIMSGIALGLRLPSNYFEDKTNDSFYTLRILHYPVDEEEAKEDIMDTEFGDFGCGEHRDYGCLTFINSDGSSDCLEIQDANGVFGKVNVNTVDEDCFIVNLGDMLNLWSGGMYQSTLHRVLPPKSENICTESIAFNDRNKTNIGRISVPFFYEPNWNTMIEPIEFDMNAERSVLPWSETDKKKWSSLEEFRAGSQSIMYGDHLKSKVLSNFSM